MLHSKRCGKCGGNLYQECDGYGDYEFCLQCGSVTGEETVLVIAGSVIAEETMLILSNHTPPGGPSRPLGCQCS